MTTLTEQLIQTFESKFKQDQYIPNTKNNRNIIITAVINYLEEELKHRTILIKTDFSEGCIYELLGLIDSLKKEITPSQ